MRRKRYLRDLRPTAALQRCISITECFWRHYESAEVLALYEVFRGYILNGYKGEGLTVPSRVAALWEDCRGLLEKYLAREDAEARS